MNNKVKISFITPVFNSEGYLSECIDSVFNQTNDSWELILIDDGSTDGSPQICDKYADKDDRIKVIHKNNTGQFDSRIKGIHIAEGQYCTGLDSDDWIEKDCVEKLVNTLSCEKVDILCWNIREFQSNNKTNCDTMPRYGKYSNEEFMRYVISSTNHSFCNKLIRTELLRTAYYGKVPLETRHTEDFILICPAICQAETIYAIDEVLYNYRQLSTSVTHIFNGKRAIDYLDASLSIREILEHYSMLKPEYIEAQNKVLTRTISNCLKKAYKTDQLDKKDIAYIRSHYIYKHLIKYINTDCPTFDVKVFMLLFVYRCDFLISVLFRKKKR